MNKPISEQYKIYYDLKIKAGFDEQYIMSWNDWQYCWGIAQLELSASFSEKLIDKNIENYKLRTELTNKRSLDEQTV